MKLAAFAYFMSVSIAIAGPFGIEKGAHKENLDIVPNSGDRGVYTLKSVPKPHPLFSHYYAEIDDSIGVCRINAATDSFTNDRYGSDARSNFEKIEKQLNGIYGKGEEFKFLKSGALWDGDGEWVESINENERRYTTVWSESKQLKDGIKSITLRVSAVAQDESFIVLQYVFDNMDQCINNREKASAGAL